MENVIYNETENFLNKNKLEKIFYININQGFANQLQQTLIYHC